MRYYISDLHFFHESLNTRWTVVDLKMQAQMNAYMIKQWNSRVRPKDEVVILGDSLWARRKRQMKYEPA